MMPESIEQKTDYMGILDKLMEEYPELEETASALSSELEDIMPMDDIAMEEEGEMMMEEGEFEPIPAELQDLEEDEEEEYSL